MEHSPLAKLPAELRNRIYEFALAGSAGFFLDLCLTPGKVRNYHKSDQVELLALTSTCRAIRRESTQLFYAINTFNISSRPSIIHLFVQAIGPANAAALRRVVSNSIRWSIHDFDRPYKRITCTGSLMRWAETLQHDGLLRTLKDCKFVTSIDLFSGAGDGAKTGHYAQTDLDLKDLVGSLHALAEKCDEFHGGKDVTFRASSKPPLPSEYPRYSGAREACFLRETAALIAKKMQSQTSS